MEIVAMTAADAAAKAQVHAIAWQHTYQPFLGQKKITFNEEKACAYAASNWAHTLLAKEGAQVIGFVDYQVLSDGAVELTAFYVLPQWQGRKVGRALWRAVQERMAPNTQFELWVLSCNHQAIRFYQAIGFQLTDKQKEHRLGFVVQMVTDKNGGA